MLNGLHALVLLSFKLALSHSSNCSLSLSFSKTFFLCLLPLFLSSPCGGTPIGGELRVSAFRNDGEVTEWSVRIGLETAVQAGGEESNQMLQ